MARLSSLSRSIAGKVAIVTGAASGMGRATAFLFADEGARLALWDINSDALEVVAAEIREAGGNVLATTVDCAVQTEVEAAVALAAEHFSGLDILVNNAGLALPTPFAGEAYDEIWRKSIDIMASAQQWAVRAALPHLLRAEHPRISQHCLYRSPGRHRLQQPLCGGQTCLYRADPRHGCGIRETWYYGERYLPRSNFNRHY